MVDIGMIANSLLHSERLKDEMTEQGNSRKDEPILEDDLYTALKAVEWAGDGMGDPINDPKYFNWCPWCGELQIDGHSVDCELNAALRKAEGR